jgi:hypothetical protein
MTNYLNEEDEDDKYSSEEKISDDVPQTEVEVDSADEEEWGSDEDDDDWGNEEVEIEGDEIPDEVEEPTDDGYDGDGYDGDGYDGDGYDGEDIPDSIEEPSTAEINSEPTSEEPKGFRVLSFEDFVSK